MLGKIKNKTLKISYEYKQKKIDENYNYNVLKKLDLNEKKIKKVLENNKLSFGDIKLSWHYHLFAGFSKNNSKKKILEIGTHKGEFTNFISKIFLSSNIYTIDIPIDHQNFNHSYSRKNIKSYNDSYFKYRQDQIKKKNIKFIQSDSINLLKLFKKNYFDLIWIDGDHKNPQVSIDIFNSIYLAKKNAIIMVDDIILDNKETKNSNSDSYKFLKFCEKKKLLKKHLLIKRVNPNNLLIKKYIAVCIKL